jgi:hypothetical protein
MILKGNQRVGGTDLASHLQNEFDNDLVEVAEIRGTVAQDLHGAFGEYEAIAAGTRSLFTASRSIRPRRSPAPSTGPP